MVNEHFGGNTLKDTNNSNELKEFKIQADIKEAREQKRFWIKREVTLQKELNDLWGKWDESTNTSEEM